MNAHSGTLPAGRRVIVTTTALLTTALGVTVGFAWNSAVTALNRHLVEQPRYQVLFDFVWAVAITAVVVGLILAMGANAPQHVEPEHEEHRHGSEAQGGDSASVA